MTPRLLPRTAAALAAAAVFGVSGMAQQVLAADGVGDVPSVAVQPADPAKDDPNGGQWFVLSLAPGASGTVRAKVSNPAKVTQTVTFELRDLVFADDGTPSIAKSGKQEDVGSWGGPTQKSYDLPALKSVIVPFKVTVPGDVEPGDHVGAIVASTANKQGQFRVIRTIATRFYVTVPGEAVRAYSIASIKADKNSSFWPSTVNTEVVLRNDGRTRVRPTVTIGGAKADGSRLLLSRSVEKYTAAVKIPWYGGPVSLKVHAVTDDGSVRNSEKSIFVIPWGLIVSVIVGAAFLWLVFKLIQRRVRRVSSLRSDVERLERLVARQGAPSAAEPVAAAVAAPPNLDEDDDQDDDEDAVAALLIAIKRAQRSGSPTSVARLALAIHDANGPAVPWLVGVLGKVEGSQRDDVLAALRTSDPVAVAGEVRRADLSDADKAAILAEDPPAAPAKPARKAASKATASRATAAKTPAAKPKADGKAPASRRTGAKSTTATAAAPPAPRTSTDDAD